MKFTWHGITEGLSRTQAKRKPINSNQYTYSYSSEQILPRQYINISIKGASTIFGLVSKAIEK